MPRGGLRSQTSRTEDDENAVETTTTTVMASTGAPPFKKLKGEQNWTTWKMLMEVHLGDHDDVLHTELAEVHQRDRTSSEFRRDQYARKQLLFGVEEAVLTHVAGATTAFQMWKKLCAAFEDKGARRRATLLKALMNLKQTGDLKDYVLQFKSLVQRIAETGRPVHDDDLLSVLLFQGVKPDHLTYCQLLERTCQRPNEAGDLILPFDAISDELMREGIRIKSEGGASASSKVALKAEGRSHHHHQQQRSQPYGYAARGQHRGGRGGGHSRRPWNSRRGSQGRWSGQHHQQQTTPTTTTIADDSSRTSTTASQSAGTHPKCKFCKKTNHAEKDCWFKKGEETSAEGGKGPIRWKVAIAKRGATGNSKDSSSKILKADVVQSVNTKSMQYYLDSGSFDCLQNDLSCIHNFRSYPREPIECAGDQVLHTEGAGTVYLDESKNNGLSQIQVKYCSKLSSNLLSVSSIAKSNLTTVFVDNYGGVFRKEDILIRGKPLLKAIESNGTYKVNLQVSINNQLLKASLSSDKYKLWHARFGHAGKNSLDKLRNGLVDGIPHDISENTETCQICFEAKQTRAPLPKGGANRASQLLEIIHTDVCQVTDTESWEGYRYFVTFTDDKSRYTMIGLMKRKSEVFDKFKTYKALVEKHTGKVIKTVRSDNGTEYCNHEFDKFFNSEGIIRQLSIVDTPEQNGVGERVNRTLLEKDRALLMEAGLDIKFWAVALEMAVYLKNISPSKSVDGMVPYQAWTGSKPNVENLRIFGCLAFVHVSRKKSKKLGSRSKPCIFMGIDEEKKGFKLMSLDQPGEYFVERSVQFDESRFPAKQLKTKQGEIHIDTHGEMLAAIPSYTEVIISSKHKSCSKNDMNGQTQSRDTVPLSSNNDSMRHNDSQSNSEEYSTTSISRLSNDLQSATSQSSATSESSATSQSSSSTIIDIETISTLSSEQDFGNLGKRIRIPKQFPDFVTYGKGRPILLASKTDSTQLHTNQNIFVPNTNPNIHVPNTVREALCGPESKFWTDAMLEELSSFDHCKAWTLEPPKPGTKIVGNKWVFKRKLNPDGSILYRARLVAKGYTQTYGVDYYETFAPVVRRTTLRLLFSVAVNFDLRFHHWDVKTAFLNGDLSETVYMSQPEGFIAEGMEGMVCRLNKAVYGLKQAARSWNLKADTVLKSQGFINFTDEPCVYIKRSNESIIIIALYVDDFYIVFNNNSDKDELLRVLKSHFKIKDLGEARDCLGMKIVRNWKNGTLLLHQEDYVNSILSKFNMQNCNGVDTPMEDRLKLKDMKSGEKGNMPYQELIGCLLYLSVCTRPDISYAVSFLSQYNTCYTRTHWNLAKRLLSYLKSTAKLGLNYAKIPNPSFCLIGFADADFAGNPADYKSYSGYCFTLDNNLISWESKKQKLAAQSTTESEYIAITEAVKESLYLNALVNNFFQCGDQRVTIFNDNTSAIKLAYSDGFRARTKHFGCRIQLVRDCVQDGLVCIEHMSTKIMPADILTKPLGRVKHEECVQRLRLNINIVPSI